MFHTITITITDFANRAILATCGGVHNSPHHSPEQPCSSELSTQSGKASHRDLNDIHSPDRHLNSPSSHPKISNYDVLNVENENA